MQIRHANAEDAAAIAQIHVETWQHAYSGIISSAYLSSLSIPRRTSQWTNTLANIGTMKFVLVAEDGAGEVIGFVYAGPERLDNPRYRGEIYTLYVLPSR
ncbi:MAG TPA: GNAT family N-acetyltransferase, partial [Gammaproteobacteria bacterium]|nr:GNAT family N-acetyltransferase [Gammaproteobacteria bacterium]